MDVISGGRKLAVCPKLLAGAENSKKVGNIQGKDTLENKKRNFLGMHA